MGVVRGDDKSDRGVDFAPDHRGVPLGQRTSLFDGKDYFTIYDFVKAYEHFNDAEWDGEPLDPVITKPNEKGRKSETPRDEGETDGEPPERSKKIRIKLADGKERTIQHMMATTFWSPDGKPISAAQFVEKLFGEVPRFFKDEDELRRIWSRTSSLLRSSLSFWYTHGYRRRNEKIPCDRTMLRLL